MTNLSLSRKDTVWLLLVATLVLFYLVVAGAANADLTVGRFALFMDERITFDGVKNILHPAGWSHFLWSIADGGDHRYGRSLWNSMALFCALPEYFFGEPGQIFAGRMSGVVILLSAFLVLTFTFVKRWYLRFLLMASLLAMPYADYYMSMPKPEPLQMLFIAIFLYFFRKEEMSFRGSYWIFLGLAFGTKISALPLVGVFGAAAIIKGFSRRGLDQSVCELLRAAGFFLAGLALAVPILLKPVAISLLLFCLFDTLVTRKLRIPQSAANVTMAALLIAGNGLAAWWSIYLGEGSGLAVWVGNTFLNTGHGSDLRSIGFGSWVDFFVHDWMVAPAALTALLLAIVLALLACFGIRQVQKSGVPEGAADAVPALVLLSGLALVLAIFSGVHRLWGFYLFPGTILALVGLFGLVEIHLPEKGCCPGREDRSAGRYLSLSALALVAVITVCWWFPLSIQKYRQLARRTAAPQYRDDYLSYLKLTDFLAGYADGKKGAVSVSFDPSLFIPVSCPKYKITEFWGEGPHWGEGVDVVVVAKDNAPCSVVPNGSPGSAPTLAEGSEYDKRYERRLRLPNGGEVFVARGE
ncbi:hypothetical protein LPW11_17805 [Geomonas sp. RF6]|uniref:hypothetical protein n=1 Tax=Geomonas sp. RF6 TaxID=2897342 RepID=UPI001E34FC2A|nr:hypothetical protein [Geomonas sp. RF6]UFS69737.1 hypothetical protein LPW11_17805 [Geomonas sp. RF6]